MDEQKRNKTMKASDGPNLMKRKRVKRALISSTRGY